MKSPQYKGYDELPLFPNVNLVAQVLGVSQSSGHELMRKLGFPVLRVDSRMAVSEEQFIRWVTEHTEEDEHKWTNVVSQFPMTSGGGVSNHRDL